jgi:GNAT superfamily N-acetyltransferase
LKSGLWERLEVEFVNKRHWPKGTPGGKGGKFAPGDASLPGDPILTAPVDVRRLTTYPSRVRETASFLGHSLDVPSLAFLAGAIPGSVAGFTQGRAFGGSPQWSAWSHGDDPDWADWHTQVYLAKDKEGNKFLYLNLMEVNQAAQAQGIGLRVLCSMVDEAIRQGLSDITLWAAGKGNGTLERRTRWCGYYTWARLGFDSKISTRYQGKEVHTIHELLAMPGGREHWYRHGYNYEGVFDLRENSYSRAVLRSYAQSKGLTVHFANTRRWPKGTPGGKGGKFMPKDAQIESVPTVIPAQPILTGAIPSAEVETVSDILGHDVDRPVMARLAGAIPGSKVIAYDIGGPIALVCNALAGEPPAWESSAVLFPGHPLRLHLGIVRVASGERGSGLGTQILSTIISEAAKQGIHHVTLTADGRGDGTLEKREVSGYYTWARLGFDGPVAFSEGPFQHVSSLHELLDLPGGREYWYRQGSKYQGIFDLREGSRSRAILRAYAQAKGLTIDFSYPDEEADPVPADFSRPFDPTGWVPWILTRGRRRGTPVYKKGREYRDFLPAHPLERQQLDKRFFDGIAFSNLSHDQRILYTNTMTSILDRLPPVALSRVHQHVQTFRFYPDLVSVGTDMSQRDRQWVLTEPRFTKEDRDGHLLEYLRNMEQARQGHLGGGMFYPYKEMFLDGPPLGRSSYMDIRSWGSTPIKTSLSHLYAHELTHAIDGDKQLQNDPTWYNAWVKDLVKKPAATTYPLSAYASEGGVHEGLAEFGRLIYSGQFDLGKVEQRYPNCTAFFKNQKLWPTS